ncbi:DUF2381 family protein [Pyxidicoccus xibeiensis]|uniref:DUF2381 family protein n=1 Tax=Pyxidicoccus xibeiensis TaxID=2906759 RepID=UPI0020A7E756|nr:DUF2381 family protein [Pyxidicoccus xibeiensis]MCP3140218.1 DUF2381 family protein [Pyxidicoccus xibeiensis]
MLHVPGLLLVLLSLGASAAEAQPAPSPSLQFRRVPLIGRREVVRLAPGIPATLNFDAEINPEKVRLDAPAPVKLLSISENAVTLVAEGDLGAGVTLRVPFLNAPTLAEPAFQLVTASDVADAQVLVYRSANAPELMQARLTELEARSAACEAQLSTERERSKATGPAASVLSGQVNAAGVRVAELKRVTNVGTAGLKATSVRRFLADKWAVLEVEVTNTSGQPWRPGRAWLESASTGRRVNARTVSMAPEVLATGEPGRVVVEFERPPGSVGEVFRLVVEDADGARPLTVAGVVMKDPAQEKSGP